MRLRKLLDNPRRTLIGILLVSVLLRVGTAFYLGNEVVSLPGIADQESYHNLALRVLGGHGFSFGEPWWPATRANEPTAHWSYLYTLFITAVYAIFGNNPIVPRLIQAVAVGILMPWLTFRIARRLFAPSAKPAPLTTGDLERGEVIGLLAAAGMAVYTYFFYYASALMTESFYITAILWSFDVAIGISQAEQPRRRDWLLLGLALGTAVLLRQLFLLFVPFLLLWLWWSARPKLLQLAAPLVVIVGLMLPWIVRNYLAFDQFVLLNTNSGYAFFWGNHPIHGNRFVPILPSVTYYNLIPADLLHLNEAALDSALLEIGMETVFADLGRYIMLSISRIPPYFAFWPSAESSLFSNLARVGSFGIFLPFMLVGLVNSIRYRFASPGERLASPFTLVYLFMLVYTGIHVLTWTLIRYRLPIDAFLIIFAGLGLLHVSAWFRSRSRQKTEPMVTTE